MKPDILCFSMSLAQKNLELEQTEIVEAQVFDYLLR